MKVFEILNAKSALEKLNTTEFEDPSDAVVVARFIKNAADILKGLEERRVQLVEKYGEKQEDGNSKVTEKNIKKFEKDFNKLLNEEVALVPLKASNLYFKIKPIELMPLLAIIE